MILQVPTSCGRRLLLLMTTEHFFDGSRPPNKDRPGHKPVAQTTEKRIPVNHVLRKAMQYSDNYVIEMDYSDAKGNQTHRVVSPIRFMGSRRFLGLCLCREQPRQFQLSRCKNLRLVPADQVLMPVPMA